MSGKFIGVVLLFVGIENPDGELVDGAQCLYGGKGDVLLLGNPLDLLQNFLALVQPCDDGMSNLL